MLVPFCTDPCVFDWVPRVRVPSKEVPPVDVPCWGEAFAAVPVLTQPFASHTGFCVETCTSWPEKPAVCAARVEGASRSREAEARTAPTAALGSVGMDRTFMEQGAGNRANISVQGTAFLPRMRTMRLPEGVRRTRADAVGRTDYLRMRAPRTKPNRPSKTVPSTVCKLESNRPNSPDGRSAISDVPTVVMEFRLNSK